MGKRRGSHTRCVVLISVLLLWCPGVSAQQVGEAVGVEGTAELFRTLLPDWQAMLGGDEVLGLDQLRTQIQSKLDVLLLTGHKFVLSESVEIKLEEEPTPPSGKRLVLTLAKGAVRVVTSGVPGAVLVTRTPTGQAVTRNTGYIASCGPPTTPTLETCLFVGVYGQTEVESLAFPGRPVLLQPQTFTFVRRNQLPDSPQRMPDVQFQALVDATTVIGTGTRQDRIGLTERLATGEDLLQSDLLLAQIPQTPPTQAVDPDIVIDQPLPQYDPGLGGIAPGVQPLPPPPPPPGF